MLMYEVSRKLSMHKSIKTENQFTLSRHVEMHESDSEVEPH